MCSGLIAFDYQAYHLLFGLRPSYIGLKCQFWTCPTFLKMKKRQMAEPRRGLYEPKLKTFKYKIFKKVTKNSD